MRQIGKPLKFFIAGAATVLAPVLFIVLCVLLLEPGLEYVFGPDGGRTIDVFSEHVSPNGTRVATVFRNMGGGAAGWCYHKVSLRPVGEELNIKETVFTTNCNVKIEPECESDELLRISYTGEDDLTSLRQYKHSRDGAVRILYSGR